MPHRLHELAEKLKDLDISKAPYLDQHQIRSVVNRAYYAAFLAARSFCEKQGYIGNGGAHERVVNALLGQRAWRTEGNRLNQIKALRHQADYQWAQPMSARDAQSTLKKSRQIIDALHGP